MLKNWNLSLLYASKTDPQIERDLQTLESAIENFEKKYKNNKTHLSDEDALFEALTEYEKIEGLPEGSRPIMYFHYLSDLNSADQEVNAQLATLEQRYAKISNKILFFGLSLGTLPAPIQKQFLQSKKLEHFRYFLKTLFLESKYQLTEPEEKILTLKSLPSHSLWVDGQERLLNSQTVAFKGKQIPLAQAHMKISDLNKADRHALHKSMMETQKKISAFAEAEINAVITDKKINDELRGFQEPYSATILGYENDEKAIINFVDTVTAHFSIAHKFYDVKSRLLKMPRLTYADRAAKIGKTTTKYSFEKSAEIVSRAFKKVDPEFSAILARFLKNGQIDADSKKGKSGGAYCSSTTGLPTFVLLNHADSADSVMTFGHEMGHAINSELSKSQTPLYEGYTISVAEVASTLFENFVFAEIFETLSDKEKIIALHDRLQDDIQTIFRQIACFNFETELHRTIRAKGSLSKEEIGTLLNKHMSAYLGPRFKMTGLDGYFFVNWSHIRRFFYVYSYAYGQLISKALYKKYQADKNYINEIKKFLSAGGSKSPEDIFRDIGIDTTKPDFFIAGLKSIEDDIKKLNDLL